MPLDDSEHEGIIFQKSTTSFIVRIIINILFISPPLQQTLRKS
jgi:hypothetical protein